MGALRNLANDVFRNFRVDGNPESGPYTPTKAEIRNLFGEADDSLTAATEAVSGVAADVAADALAVQSALDVATGQACFAPGGRLTLASGVPVAGSDVAGATTLYYAGCFSPRIPVWTGSAFASAAFTELALPLDPTVAHAGAHVANNIYDVFAVLDGAILRIATGPAWAGLKSRGAGAGTTELEVFTGLFVNKNSITLRYGAASGNTLVAAARRATYLGSFLATANGQASDTRKNRMLFNAYNQVPRPVGVQATGTWSWITALYRVANNDGNNVVGVLLGLAGIAVDLTATSLCVCSAAADYQVAIGVDTSETPSGDGTTGFGNNAGVGRSISAFYRGSPGLGYSSLRWLERGSGLAVTQTWLGSDGVNKTGLSGMVTM